MLNSNTLLLFSVNKVKGRTMNELTKLRETQSKLCFNWKGTLLQKEDGIKNHNSKNSRAIMLILQYIMSFYTMQAFTCKK